MESLVVHSLHDPDHHCVFDCLADPDFEPDAIVALSQHEWQYNMCFTQPCDFEYLSQYAKNKQIDFVIVSGAHQSSLPLHDVDDAVFSHTQVLSYPVHWFVSTYRLFQQRNPHKCTFVDLSDPEQIQWLYITLNNKPFSHRAMIMDTLAKHQMLDQGKYSWDTFQELDGRSHTHQPDSIYWYAWQYWQPRKTMIDEVPAWCTGGNNYGWNGELPDCHARCFFQIVGESTTEAIFFTEKVVPPLMTGKPFLAAAAPGYHQALRDLGFELYDEIFDYEFDTITDTQQRVSAMMQNFVQYRDCTPEQLADLYTKIAHKAQHNSTHIEHIAHSAYQYVPKIIQQYCTEQNPAIVNNEIYHHWQKTRPDLQ